MNCYIANTKKSILPLLLPPSSLESSLGGPWGARDGIGCGNRGRARKGGGTPKNGRNGGQAGLGPSPAAAAAYNCSGAGNPPSSTILSTLDILTIDYWHQPRAFSVITPQFQQVKHCRYSVALIAVGRCARAARSARHWDGAPDAGRSVGPPTPTCVQINSPPLSYYRFIPPTVQRTARLNNIKPYVRRLQMGIE